MLLTSSRKAARELAFSDTCALGKLTKKVVPFALLPLCSVVFGKLLFK